MQLACAKLLGAIYEQDFLPVSYGYRPKRGAKEAVGDLGFNLQYGRFGHVVEADIKGFFDTIDHDWLLKMLSLRIDDRAFLNLIRKWLKAGILDTDGQVLHPVTGTPQGGIVSPILANVYLHYALDLWFERLVKPRCGGQAILIRYADDFVCAFQYLHDAERFYRVLPKRLNKFRLEVAPEKTRILRFSRFHPGLPRRFAFLGFELYWRVDWRGELRVMKRTNNKDTHRNLNLKGILMMKIVWMGIMLLFLSGCAAPRFEGASLDRSLVEDPQIVVVMNSATRTGFLDAIEEWLLQNSYSYVVAPDRSHHQSDKLTLQYVGRWRWDLAIFLSEAEISAFHQGQRVGRVVYEAPNSGHPAKFGEGADRVKYMLDVLFGKLSAAEATQKVVAQSEEVPE